MSSRYDVLYRHDRVSLQHHFCRDIDCFGTNENHGFTLEEAKEMIIKWHQDQIEYWKNYTDT